MSRKRIIAGNWKMHKTAAEAVLFIKKLIPLVESSQPLVYLAVPFTAIAQVAKAAKGSPIIIGAQNMNDAEAGAFTGEIAANMLKEAGAEFVLLGHSERRHIFQESDHFINQKVLRALKENLQPILCIGETLEEREKGETKAVLEKQLEEGLKKVSKQQAPKLIVAYEPVWAIGTGKVATPKMVEEAHRFSRAYLSTLFTKEIAEKIPLLYGGSVKPENSKALAKTNNVDGALVGGASLEAEVFAKIIQGF